MEVQYRSFVSVTVRCAGHHWEWQQPTLFLSPFTQEHKKIEEGAWVKVIKADVVVGDVLWIERDGWYFIEKIIAVDGSMESLEAVVGAYEVSKVVETIPPFRGHPHGINYAIKPTKRKRKPK